MLGYPLLGWILDLAGFHIASTCVHRPTSSEVTCAGSSSENTRGSPKCQYISVPFDACAVLQPDPEPVSSILIVAFRVREAGTSPEGLLFFCELPASAGRPGEHMSMSEFLSGLCFGRGSGSSEHLTTAGQILSTGSGGAASAAPLLDGGLARAERSAGVLLGFSACVSRPGLGSVSPELVAQREAAGNCHDRRGKAHAASLSAAPRASPRWYTWESGYNLRRDIDPAGPTQEFSSTADCMVSLSMDAGCDFEIDPGRRSLATVLLLSVRCFPTTGSETYVDMPAVSNDAYLDLCPGPPSALQEAQAACDAEPSCSGVVLSYDCQPYFWRYCTGSLAQILGYPGEGAPRGPGTPWASPAGDGEAQPQDSEGARGVGWRASRWCRRATEVVPSGDVRTAGLDTTSGDPSEPGASVAMSMAQDGRADGGLV
ncbi:unnamed protein product [Prorocentrum cordatum]|uniref:Uncharacterized protein n=1 Tax=Prorocentrum cordatum TaxID=2364126 RepID=A0ABN9T1W5_9DINO|nr:unnamed protein product [Polarella glacialis]